MNLSHPPSQIIASWLIAEGIFGAYNASTWPLYKSQLPEKSRQNDAAAIYDTAGIQEGTLQQGRELINHPGIQIKVRSKVYKDGWNKADDALQALRGLLREEVTLDSTTYRIEAVNPSSDIVPLGQEVQGTERRELFTVNFLATITVK